MKTAEEIRKDQGDRLEVEYLNQAESIVNKIERIALKSNCTCASFDGVLPKRVVEILEEQGFKIKVVQIRSIKHGGHYTNISWI